jgi:hypothetical protein
MKRLILFVIAIAAAAQAQQPTPCLKLKKVKIDGHVLHQNGAARVQLVFTAQHCYVYSGSPLGAQMPEFEVESQPGLGIEMGASGAARFDQSTGDFLRAQEISLDLNVLASPELELGEHKVPGVVRYQVIDEVGNLSPETLSFDIPLKVDTPRTKPAAGSYGKPGDFFDKHPIWTKALIPVLIVAFIPLFIIASAMGWDGC